MRTLYKYTELSGKQKDEFERIVNKFLSEGFLTNRKEESKRDYYFVESHRQIFAEYFKVSDHDLEVDETHGAMHLINIPNIKNHSFKMQESIVLLILRILYFEKLQSISANENVIITVDAILKAYNALKLRNMPIDESILKECISLFRSMGIVEPLDSDEEKEYTQIVVYPIVPLAVKPETIKEIYERISSDRQNLINEF